MLLFFAPEEGVKRYRILVEGATGGRQVIKRQAAANIPDRTSPSVLRPSGIPMWNPRRLRSQFAALSQVSQHRRAIGQLDP